MVDVRPFRALRPSPERAAQVAAPPYDVVDVAQARAAAAGNPHSFLHVSRPEIDLPDDVDPGSDAVHAAGRRALTALIEQAVLTLDAVASFYVYRQQRADGRSGSQVQTGVVGCAAVADYESGAIRTHEHTRPDKEDDRVRHIAALGAHDEPVFLLAAPAEPGWQPVADVITRVTAEPALCDLVTDDGIRHVLWRVDGPDDAERVRAAFAAIPRVYIADGHHRSAAAARVSRLAAGSPGAPPDEPDKPDESDAFPVVIFPGAELVVLPYNRVVADLGPTQTPSDLLAGLADTFDVRAASAAVEPAARHTVGMYCDGTWYELVAREGVIDESDPIARLDVSLLQDRVLGPLLGIHDPRTDTRLGFVGGVHGTAELARRVDAGRREGRQPVAFSLHPTSVAELVAVADTGQVMPPKSTWFEPKLRSGLFVHLLR